LANIAFIVSRVVVYVGVFLVLHIAPRGDVFGAYWPEAKLIQQHLVPYRDFLSSYAPLHPYLDALVIDIWFSPLAIILLAICVEFLILPLWFRIGRVFLTEQEVRSSALLYIASAISLQFVTIDGQDNVFIAVLLVLALILAYRHCFIASGAAVGLGIAAVKFLPLLYVPAFFVTIPRRWRWLAGAFAIVAIVYGVCLALRLPILAPLAFEGQMRSAGNLPFVFESVTGLTVPSLVWDLLTLAVCGSVFLLIDRESRRASPTLRLRILTFGFAALTLALVLFSKKSWPPYLMLSLFPICLLIKSGSVLGSVAFGIFGVLAVFSTSYWSTVLAQFSATEFHRGLLAHQPRCFFFLVIQLALLFSYARLLQLSLRQIRITHTKNQVRLEPYG
jgi:hypothetical protein